MPPCEITIYSSTGHVVHRAHLEREDCESPLALDEAHRQHVDDAQCCYATIRAGTELLALYIAAPWVPRAALRLPKGRRRGGRWLTSRLQLGAPGIGRAWVGPEIFLRQLDIGEVDAWLAPVLLGLRPRVEVQQHTLEDMPVFSWQQAGSSFYFTSSGAHFHLYGGGNTPTERLQQVLREEAPTSAPALLWSIGAVRLD